MPGVIMPFPGGIAASGSKAGSRYKFTIASTYEAFCPTLRDKLGDAVASCPTGVGSVMEIIINGADLPTIARATQAAIAAAVDTPGLIKISAGNYGGRLGKSFVYLRPERQGGDTVADTFVPVGLTAVGGGMPLPPWLPRWRRRGRVVVMETRSPGYRRARTVRGDRPA